MGDAVQKQDWADQHVERWRDHWLDVPFDDDTEAILIRMTRILRYLRRADQESIARVGLQDFEYTTLHQLMVRATPGIASPSELAEDLGISGAGMTGRLDALEKAGWIRREAHADDRRRVSVEVTEAGLEMWRRAMTLRGETDHDLVAALTVEERTILAALLKKMTLRIEP